MRMYDRQAGECFFTMAQIKEANQAGGFHFFERATMRFFKSKVATRRPLKGCYFVTSEQFDYNSPRLYSVRRVDLKTGNVATVGDFQAYRSLDSAKRAIASLPSPE